MFRKRLLSRLKAHLLKTVGLAMIASPMAPAAGLPWSAGSGNWHNGDNWEDVLELSSSGVLTFYSGVPRPEDNAFLTRDGLNLIGLSNDAHVADLTMDKRNSLRTNGHALTADDVLVKDNAGLRFNQSDAANLDAQLGKLTVNGGSVSLMDQDASLRINRQLMLGSATSLNGKGHIAIGPTFGNGLVNDGEIRVNPYGAFGGGDGTLTLFGNGLAKFDLDGVGENGVLSAATVTSDTLNRLHLVIDGDQADPFNSTMNIGANDSIDFRRKLDVHGGTINLQGRGGPATLRGSDLNLGLETSVFVNGEGVLEGTYSGLSPRFRLGPNSTLHLNGDGELGVLTGFDWNRENTTLKVSGNNQLSQNVTRWMRSGLDHLVVEGGSFEVIQGSVPSMYAEFDGLVTINNGTLDMQLAPMDTWSTREPMNLTNGTLQGSDFEVETSLVGAGVIKTRTFGNRGVVEAVGGTLDFQTNTSLDGENIWRGLVGFDEPRDLSEDGVGRVLAERGSVLISGPLDSNVFRGEVRVANGNSFRAPNATMFLANENSISDRARIWLDDGTFEVQRAQLNGRLDVDRPSTIEGTSFAFDHDSLTLVNTTLTMDTDTIVYDGSVVGGGGTLVNAEGRRMKTKADQVQIALHNEGELLIGDKDRTLEYSTLRVGEVTVPAFRQTPTGTLAIDIDSASDEHDLLTVLGGGSILDGTIRITEISEASPVPYDPTVVVLSHFLSGEFATVDGASTDTPYGYAVTYQDRRVNVTYALAGDVNLDRVVNFPDFLKVSREFGNAGSWADGDFDGDGRVAFPDFLALSANFGTSVAAASGTTVSAVPEPSAWSILLLGMLGLITRRRRLV